MLGRLLCTARPLTVLVAVSLTAALAACSSTGGGPGGPGGQARSPSRTTQPAPRGDAVTGSPLPGASSPRPPATRASSVGSGPPTVTRGPGAASQTASCAAAIVERLSPAERAGQLLMVGLDAGAAWSSLDRLVASRHLGGVILLGGWQSGAASVRSATARLRALASEKATGGLGLWLAADQEGGAVQQLRGPGFDRMPSALSQGAMSPSELSAASAGWARQLRSAGVNVNLAPVADTVPADLGPRNQPIGRFGRSFSSDPGQVAARVAAVVTGMHRGGVAATVKHFPGLGRVTGNTDTTSAGITDRVTTADDDYLRPFTAGIRAGADFVMISSAMYPRIGGTTNAVFSRAVVTDLLRVRLGYQGVAITDDVGAAKAVAAVPVGERATRFVAAGGDVVLTARPDTVPQMHDALTAAMAREPAFAAKVEASALRVTELKVRMGLAPC